MLFLIRPTVAVTILSVILVISAKEEGKNQRQPVSIVSDLPTKNDLLQYIRVLDKLINYSKNNKYEIDMNYHYGIFLGNVVLKSTLQFKKFKTLPAHLNDKLNEIIEKSDELIIFSQNMADTIKNSKNYQFYTLFSNETEWLTRYRSFELPITKQLRIPSQKVLEEKYDNWNRYIQNLKNEEDWSPKPEESDICLISLSKNPSQGLDKLGKCRILDNCNDILMSGSDFGYALTHRFLLLFMARYGRGCVLFTPYLDKEMMRRFCHSAYGEAKYIASHGYQMADLMTEQMALCSVAGSKQFMSRSWLNTVLEMQSPSGCFNTKKTKRGIMPNEDTGSNPEVSLDKVIEMKLNPLSFHQYPKQTTSTGCIRHMNGVAFVIFSNAIAYILNEEYV